MLAVLLGHPFYLDLALVMATDLDELGYLMGLVAIRLDMEKPRGK